MIISCQESICRSNNGLGGFIQAKYSPKAFRICVRVPCLFGRVAVVSGRVVDLHKVFVCIAVALTGAIPLFSEVSKHITESCKGPNGCGLCLNSRSSSVCATPRMSIALLCFQILAAHSMFLRHVAIVVEACFPLSVKSVLVTAVFARAKLTPNLRKGWNTGS